MSTKTQLIDRHIKSLHEVRKDAFEEVYELLGLKYWDNDMIKKYLKDRIKTQEDAISEIDKERAQKNQLDIKDIPATE